MQICLFKNYFIGSLCEVQLKWKSCPFNGLSMSLLWLKQFLIWIFYFISYGQFYIQEQIWKGILVIFLSLESSSTSKSLYIYCAQCTKSRMGWLIKLSVLSNRHVGLCCFFLLLSSLSLSSFFLRLLFTGTVYTAPKQP